VRGLWGGTPKLERRTTDLPGSAACIMGRDLRLGPNVNVDSD
jgi:hypothetical protein